MSLFFLFLPDAVAGGNKGELDPPYMHLENTIVFKRRIQFFCPLPLMLEINEIKGTVLPIVVDSDTCGSVGGKQ